MKLAAASVVNYGKYKMELLLNLVWVSLALAAFLGFARGRTTTHIPYRKSLIALGCALLLLFPVVSASDDLHPTQAVMEEASKRVQLAVAPLHLLRTSHPVPMLPAMLALCLMCALVAVLPWRPLGATKLALAGVTVPFAGRAPPTCWN